MKIGIKLQEIELELGKIYSIRWSRRIIEVKLIQVTEFGFNFLHEKENRCILRRHLYMPTKYREKYNVKEKLFIIPVELILLLKNK
jgi:hypothetical protein